MDNEKISNSLKKLREETKERKFNQGLDLIINLKDFDLKKEKLNLTLTVPKDFCKPKILAFLNEKSAIVDSITKDEFSLYKDKRKIKKIVSEYAHFIASANLMPDIAKTFGRYLGQAGKMPSPQLGILKTENEEEIKKIMKVFNKVVIIKSKEASIKVKVGSYDMKDEEIAENISYVYKKVLDVLPKKNQSIKNVLIKFTMSKPIKI
jgi:large subunit ribosomal protein L1